MVAEANNIAALRALSAVPDNVVYVLGYSTTGDGGQGSFLYVASDTSSSDNGGTIIVDTAGHRWHRDTQSKSFSVKWFGAGGNGSTDDTAAIQATLNAVGQGGGGEVFIPAGTYKTSSTISVSYSNLSMCGVSRDAAIVAPVSDNFDCFYVYSSSGLEYVRIANLAIIPASSATGSTASIHQAGTASVTDFNNLYILGGAYGIYIESSASGAICKIDNAYIASCSSAGIVLGSSAGIVTETYINRVNISACSGYGISLINCSGLYMSQVDVLLTSGIGINFNPGASESVRFVFCDQVLSDSSSSNGWSFTSSSSGIISNVICTNCWAAASGSNGIFLNTSGLNGFSWGNGHIRANKNHGVLAGSGSNINISNSQIFQNGTAASDSYNGISITGGVNLFSLTNNFCGSGGYDQQEGSSNQQGYGIFIASGSNNFVVVGNICYGNITGGVLNESSGSNTYVAGNIT